MRGLRQALLMPLCLVLLLAAAVCDAKTLYFGGKQWQVRANGNGGPGPNRWSEKNAWVDGFGQLHLKISEWQGTWFCAEVYTLEPLGFGQYQWFVVSRLDQLDRNVVLGLFPYSGPDGQNEIDIEIARWGNAAGNPGNFTVYPARSGIPYTTATFPFTLSGTHTTHRFDWRSSNVAFRMQHGHRWDEKGVIANWDYRPEKPLNRIPQVPLPLHLNLWLHKGNPPSDGKPVEVIIKSFSYRK